SADQRRYRPRHGDHRPRIPRAPVARARLAGDGIGADGHHGARARDPYLQPADRRLVPPRHAADEDRPPLPQGTRPGAGRACAERARGRRQAGSVTTAPLGSSSPIPIGSPAPATPLGSEVPVAAPWQWASAVRRFVADRWAMAALAFLLVLHLVALLAPWAIPHLLHRSAFRQRMNDVVQVAGGPAEVVSEDGVPVGPSR